MVVLHKWFSSTSKHRDCIIFWVIWYVLLLQHSILHDLFTWKNFRRSNNCGTHCTSIMTIKKSAYSFGSCCIVYMDQNLLDIPMYLLVMHQKPDNWVPHTHSLNDIERSLMPCPKSAQLAATAGWTMWFDDKKRPHYTLRWIECEFYITRFFFQYPQLICMWTSYAEMHYRILTGKKVKFAYM